MRIAHLALVRRALALALLAVVCWPVWPQRAVPRVEPLRLPSHTEIGIHGLEAPDRGPRPTLQDLQRLERQLEPQRVDNAAPAPPANAAGTAPAEAEPSAHRFWKGATDSLGAPTRDRASAYVLMRVFATSVVLTTNFIQPGHADAPVVTLTHQQAADAGALQHALQALSGAAPFDAGNVLKIVTDADPAGADLHGLFDKDDQSLRIDTSVFRQAELFLPDGRPVYGLERYDRPAGPPRWVAKLNDCCVRTGAPPDVAAWQRLHAVPFDRAGVQLVSLFRDSATSDMLSRALPRSRLLSGPGEIRGEPLEAIRRLAASGPRGAPLIVLGHAEGSAFRIDGSEGTAVSFEALTRLAGEYGRPLILLGCYTADHFARPELQHLRDYPVAGTLNLMYPRDVVPRLVAAMQGGGSMAGFIETLAAREDLTIWLSNNFLREVDGGAARSVRAPIYKQMPDGRRSIAGFVYLLLPCALGGTCR